MEIIFKGGSILKVLSLFSGIGAISNKCCSICSKTEGRIVNSKKFNRILCDRYYRQMLKYGKVLDRNQFGVLKRNIIHVKNQVAEILLHDRNGNEIGVATIDVLDVDKVKHHKWNLMGHG